MSSHDEWAAARDAAAADAEQAAARGELDWLIDMAEHHTRRATEVAGQQAVCGIAVVDETSRFVMEQLDAIAHQLLNVRELAKAHAKARSEARS
jgi:hypothetical protein